MRPVSSSVGGPTIVCCKALRETFGELAGVQRCQLHKLRNVLAHLPEALRPRIHKALAGAFSLASA